MSIERPKPTTTPPPPSVPPICPHCREELGTVSWNTQWPLAGTPDGPPMAIMLFFCPKCRTALNCQLLPIQFVLPAQQVAQVVAAMRSPIVRPQG